MEGGAVMRWLPIGDSITKGHPTASGYRGRVAALRPDVLQVGPLTDTHGLHHAGYGGEGIQHIQPHIRDWITTYDPDEVTILLGANNLAKWDASTIVDGLRDLVTRARSIPNRHPRVSVVTLTNARGAESKVAAVNAALRAHAAEWGATVLDLGPVVGPVTKDTFFDSVHPNQHGYDLMGDSFADALGHTDASGAASGAAGTGKGWWMAAAAVTVAVFAFWRWA